MNSTVTKNNQPNSAIATANHDPAIHETCQRMLSNMQDALALTRKLETVLETAHKTMLNRNIPALEMSLESQVKLLNMLQINGSLREHYLKQAGLSPDREGVLGFFSWVAGVQPENSPLSQKRFEKYWQQLEYCANRCQQLNSANGRVLARLSASTRKIIELAFTGQSSSTYDHQGQTVRPVIG